MASGAWDVRSMEVARLQAASGALYGHKRSPWLGPIVSGTPWAVW